jgi:hypothetical protein
MDTVRLSRRTLKLVIRWSFVAVILSFLLGMAACTTIPGDLTADLSGDGVYVCVDTSREARCNKIGNVTVTVEDTEAPE